MSVLKKAGIVFALFFLITAGPLWAQRKITIKLASIVPENTPWGAALNRMAAEWSSITNGEVEVVVYHGGVAGDEAEVLRKLRTNQLQAAIFTSQGLSLEMPEIITLSYPFLIRNDNELDEVLSKIRPEFDSIIARNGFVTLAWSKAGWVQIFSRTPVLTPSDMRKQRMGTNPEDLKMMQAFRTMGFQLVPVSITDVLVSLNSGMMDAIYWSPIAAAAGQVFGVVNNMTDLNLAPFMGGILMNQTAWRRIPDRFKPALLASGKGIEKDIDDSISKLEKETLSTMVRYGLKINQPTSAQMQEWYDELAKNENNLVGPIFDRALYLKIKGILEEYRKRR